MNRPVLVFHAPRGYVGPFKQINAPQTIHHGDMVYGVDTHTGQVSRVYQGPRGTRPWDQWRDIPMQVYENEKVREKVRDGRRFHPAPGMVEVPGPGTYTGEFRGSWEGSGNTPPQHHHGRCRH